MPKSRKKEKKNRPTVSDSLRPPKDLNTRKKKSLKLGAIHVPPKGKGKGHKTGPHAQKKKRKKKGGELQRKKVPNYLSGL